MVHVSLKSHTQSQAPTFNISCDWGWTGYSPFSGIKLESKTKDVKEGSLDKDQTSVLATSTFEKNFDSEKHNLN